MCVEICILSVASILWRFQFYLQLVATSLTIDWHGLEVFISFFL